MRVSPRKGVTISIPPPDTWRWLVRLAGPPRVELREAYADAGVAPRTAFDHASWDELLQRVVSEEGMVDYARLGRYAGVLDAYLARIADADFPSLARDEKLALLINLYNAATLRLVLDHLPLASIRDIVAKDRWKAKRWAVGGRSLSLAEIENAELRARFAEPRIHFAINCASVGCPKLRNRAFTGDGIAGQLEAHTKAVHRGERWCVADGDTVHLTKVYRWYEGDFRQGAGSVRAFATWYAPRSDGARRVRWLPYDWSLNAA